jgi:small subunit ribosomal protein S9
VSDVEQPEDEQRTPAGETPEEPVEAANEAPEPVAEGEQPAADEAAEQPAAQEQPQADAAEQPAAQAQEQPQAEDGEPAADVPVEDEVDETPRVKPEIPGADLVPDIVLEGEAREDGEDEDGEPTATADGETDEEQETQPIADAAISLASGARYTATGKRKTAVARVILKPGNGEYTINGKPLNSFFPRATLQRNIRQPLEAVGYEERMDVVAKMHGGGVSSQAGALRHGISRALLQADPNLRGELKKRGFLTRDPRVKERKKAGLKKARKRPQFSKR